MKKEVNTKKMKTYNNFYLDVISLPNLYRAYEKAKKGKAEKKEVIEFSKNLHENLLKLHLELLNRTYLMGDYKMFFVNDYKTRKIMAPRFKDMIVQHALFNFLEQIYEKSFIFDSYACRKNKGTHKAFKRLKSFINKSSYDDYFVKCDITKYFYSIDHQKLKIVIESILDELKKISAAPVKLPELNKSKNHIIGRFKIGLETSDELATFYGDQEINNGGI